MAGKKKARIAELEQENEFLREQGERLNEVIEFLTKRVEIRDNTIAKMRETLVPPKEVFYVGERKIEEPEALDAALTVCKADRDMLMKQNGELQKELRRVEHQYQDVIEQIQLLQQKSVTDANELHDTLGMCW